MDRITPVLKKHNYVPLKKVGSGSFGQAWLVGQEENGSQKNYVCKMIDISRCTQKEKKDALHEASVLKTLQHPYVVRYKESFLENGWLCIVQEYCEGGDLYQRIQKAKKLHQPFGEEQILRWFTQCMLGLKFIHEKHILHRDLKSSNFFLSKTGDIKMGDFGIAKVLESTAAVAKTQIGTPYYLSPEICQEKAYAWPSDIWSMGCILYEMCCLKVPFDAADLRALVHRITRGPTPSLPTHFSPAVRGLVSEILVRDHTRRPTAAVILSRAVLADRVRQLESEQAAAESSAPSVGGQEKSKNDDISEIQQKLLKDGGNKVAKAGGAAGAGGGAAAVPGPYGSDAGKYVKNQIVEYWSETHKEWLPAQITAVDSEGRIQVHCKPNAWLSLGVQAQKVRPKKDEPSSAKDNKPRPPAIPAVVEQHKPGGGRSSSYNTPRYHGAATPPVYHRQQTPPLNNYPPAGARIGSPSPFGRAGTPRLAYGVNRYTPRGGQGTPRAASPMNRPPWQNHSPRSYSGSRIY